MPCSGSRGAPPCSRVSCRSVPLGFGRARQILGAGLGFLLVLLPCFACSGAASRCSTKFGSELRARARAAIAWARERRWLPLATVVSAALAYSSYFSIHSLNTHYRIETSVYDLGVENNVVWHAVHWGPLFRTTPLGPPMTHLGYHQTYFSYVIGIVYRFAPRPETLLVVQAVMLGFAAVPLFFLAKRRLGPWVACLLATSDLLYAPLHGSNLYDFHYQPLGGSFSAHALLPESAAIVGRASCC